MPFHVFFMCSTVVEVDDDLGKEILQKRLGRLREEYPLMDEVLQDTVIAILAFPTYQEWREVMPRRPHKILANYNVFQAVSGRLPN